MNIVYRDDYEAVSKEGALFLHTFIEKNPGALVGFSSGASPRGMYGMLSEDSIIRHSSIRALGIDEWSGIDPAHRSSCFHDLEEHVFTPWGIPEERRILFNGCAEDPDMECKRMQGILAQEGPMDLCILGLGRNGHLGLNEPGASLNPNIHIAKLHEKTRKHVMLTKNDIKPEGGLTLGMADILQSREILLMACGPEKEDVIHSLLQGEVSTSLPASLLWLHGKTTVIIDRASCKISDL